MAAPKLRFDGNQAGLGQSKSGDVNSPNDWSVICGCGAFLGVLAMFRPNSEGFRTPFCPVCRHATAISKTGQIVGHFPHDITQPIPVHLRSA